MAGTSPAMTWRVRRSFNSWYKARRALPEQPRQRIKQRADEGCRRDGDDPGDHDVVGHAPTHRGDAPRGPNSDNGTSYRVRGRNRDAEPGRREQRDGAAG